jgi:hypothetical protein
MGTPHIGIKIAVLFVCTLKIFGRKYQLTERIFISKCFRPVSSFCLILLPLICVLLVALPNKAITQEIKEVEEVQPEIAPVEIIELPKPEPLKDCYWAVEQVFPQHLWSQAKLVVKLESGNRPFIISKPNRNGTTDVGCFQLNRGLEFYGDSALDPLYNTQVAYRMYSNRGWRPWYAVCPIDKSNPYGMC